MDWKVRCREKRKLPLNKRLPVIMDAICFINVFRSVEQPKTTRNTQA